MKLFLFLIFILLGSINASETIKIIYNGNTPPIKFTDKNQKPNGILIDIWKLWSERTGNKIEFIETNWDKSLKMVINGDADIHAGIYFTKERDNIFDFSKKALYKNKNYFFYNKKIATISNKNDLKPFVVGISNGYPNIFMKNNFNDIYTKTYNDSNKLNQDFVDGKINVSLSSMPIFTYFVQNNGYKIDDFIYSENSFGYEKEYFGAVKDGNLKLLQKINSGLELITQSELQAIEYKWTKGLKDNYLKETTTSDTLSVKEKEYIKNKKVINMCVDPSWEPFEAIKDGKHTGLVADYL